MTYSIILQYIKKKDGKAQGVLYFDDASGLLVRHIIQNTKHVHDVYVDGHVG